MNFGKLNELGNWSHYFLIKVALFFLGKIQFHILGNLALALFLLLQVKGRTGRLLRQFVAAAAAIFLLYHDAQIPLSAAATTFTNLAEYEWWYTLEVLLRYLTLKILLIVALLCAASYYISRYFELSIIVFAGLLGVAFVQSGIIAILTPPQKTIPTKQVANNTKLQLGSNQSLNSYLQQFFQNEQSRQIEFAESSPTAPPFDIVFLSVCSLAWDDIMLAGMSEHPLLKRFDIVFENFNSATSYSGPAVTRLLRASCGQTPHNKLSSREGVDHCLIFQQLGNLGYGQALTMNHDGRFDGFLKQLNVYGGIDSPMESQANIPVCQKAFDGSPVLCDKAVLDHWLQQRNTSNAAKQVMLFNTVSLHDGNRVIGGQAKSGIEGYKQRLSILFNDLQSFITQLEQSKRNTLLILIPEHGAALRGDKMQLSGIREIPSPSITHIPVAAKFIGPQLQRVGRIARVTADSSFLSLSALIAKTMQQNVFSQGSFSPQSLSEGLPSTPIVSQNEGSTVIRLEGKNYVTVDGRQWSAY